MTLLFIFALLISPTLFSPFYSDDFFHLLLLSDNPLLQRDMPGSIYGLFAFVDDNPASLEQMQRYSVIPWWADDNFYFRFLRPVAELSHGLDFSLFGLSAAAPFAAHLHSILLFVLLAMLFYQTTQRLFNTVDESRFKALVPKLSLLAFAIFLLDGQHVATISWVANRNALLAGIFALLSFYSYLRFDQCGDECRAGSNAKRAAFYALSLLSLILSVASSEAGLAIGMFYFSYALLLDKQGFAKGFIKILPFALIAMAWMLIHQALGYGAEPSGNSYVNPFAYPWLFTQRVLEHLPVYWFSHLTSTPAGAYWTVGGWYPDFKLFYFASAIVLGIAFMLYFWRTIAANKLIQFALLTAVFCAVPACLANPQDRLTLMQSLPMAWLFALLISKLLEQGKRGIAYVFCGLHLVISPLHLVIGSAYMHYEARVINEKLQTFDAEASIAGKDLILLGLPIGYNVMLTGVREIFDKPLPNSSLFVGNDAGEMIVTRLSDKQLLVERTTPFAKQFEDAFRDIHDKPFRVGDVIEHVVADVVVMTVDEQGYPTSIRLDFDYSVDDKRLAFYRWVEGNIVAVDVAGF